MDWLTLAGIIAKEGLAVAESIYNKWSSGQMPTAQDFADLRTMQKTTPEDLVLKAAGMAGLTPDHPKIQELLALVRSSEPGSGTPPATPATPA